jgi:hypothetical protein
MSTALADTSRTLRRFLSLELAPFLTGTRVVSLNSPVEMQDQNEQGLSIWLYRVERDSELLNLPRERVSATTMRVEPLPLRLHYLITPLLDVGIASTETEQEMLGRVLQAFHDTPVLAGALLQGGFAGTSMQLRARFEPMNLDETAKLRDILKLNNTYELAVSYEITVVNIESIQSLQTVTPVRVVMPDYGVVVERDS